MAAAAYGGRRTGARKRSPAQGADHEAGLQEVQPATAATVKEALPAAAAAASSEIGAAHTHEVLPRPIAAPLASAAFRAALAVDMKVQGGKPLEGAVATYCERITEAILGRPGIPRDELLQALSPILQGSDWDVARVERAISTIWEAAKKAAARSIAAGEPIQSLMPATREVLHKAREVLAECNARELALEEERSKLKRERRQRRSKRKVINAREQERAAARKVRADSDNEGCIETTGPDSSDEEATVVAATDISASLQASPHVEVSAGSTASVSIAGASEQLKRDHAEMEGPRLSAGSGMDTGTVAEDTRQEATESPGANLQEEANDRSRAVGITADANTSGVEDSEEDDLEEDDLEENDVEEDEPVGSLKEEVTKRQVRKRGLKWTVKSYNGGVETIWNVRENSTGHLGGMRIVARTDVAERSEMTSSLRTRSAGRNRRMDEHSATRSAHISTTTLSYSEGISDSEVTEDDASMCRAASRQKVSPPASKSSQFQAGECSTVREEVSEVDSAAASPAVAPAANLGTPGAAASVPKSKGAASAMQEPEACLAEAETLPGLTHIQTLRNSSPSMLPRSPATDCDVRRQRDSSPCLTAHSDSGVSRAPGTRLKKASSCPSSSPRSELLGLQSSVTGSSSSSTAPPPGLERPPHNLGLQSLVRVRPHSECRDGPSVFSRQVSIESFSADTTSPEHQGNAWPSTPDWWSDNPGASSPGGCFSLPPPCSTQQTCSPVTQALDSTPAAALETLPGASHNTATAGIGTEARTGLEGAASSSRPLQQAPQIIYVPACLPHRCEHCGKECTGTGSLPSELLSQLCGVGNLPWTPWAQAANLWPSPPPPVPAQAEAHGSGAGPGSLPPECSIFQPSSVQSSPKSGTPITPEL